MFELFLPLAFMLSPGSLVAAGNGIGAAGMLFGLFLLLAMACGLLTANGMGLPAETNKTGAVLRRMGLGLTAGARLLALGALATLWLAEAGYGFNEIFAPWYPNLGFSFTVLAAIAGTSLLPRPYRGGVLYLAALITLAALGYVTAMATQPHGFESWFPTMFPQKTPPLFPAGGDALQGAYLAILCLLGFELASRPDAVRGASRAALSLVLCVVVFGVYLWGGLSAADPFDMANSTVPHLLVAGISLGARGKQIMAIAVILGTFAAVLALLCACLRQMLMLVRMPDNDLLRRVLSLLCCGGIATLLMLGWAGEPRLESLILAAITCWFAGYALIQCSLIARGIMPPLAVLALLVYLFAAWMTFLKVDDLTLFAYACGGIALAGCAFAFTPPPRPAEETKAEKPAEPAPQPTKS